MQYSVFVGRVAPSIVVLLAASTVSCSSEPDRANAATGTSTSIGGSSGLEGVGASSAVGTMSSDGATQTSATVSSGSNSTGAPTAAVNTGAGGMVGTATAITTDGTTSASSMGGGDATTGSSVTMGGSGGGAGGSDTITSASTGEATTGTGGAEPVPCATNRVADCSGTNPVECHFGGDPGDYVVTVDLGGANAGDMYVDAESYRRVLGSVTTDPGQTKRFAFFVNVRQPEGQPIQNVPAGTPGLDLYVRGAAPELSAVCYEAMRPAPKVWIAGDSTVCDQSDTNYAGWAQHLPQFFTVPVAVANLADSGESSGSFLGSGNLWGAIKQGWSAGDWVIIQFGHNDKNVTAASFESNLKSMLTQAKAAEVHPVLVTPTSRVGYSLESEHVNSTGADLPQIIRDLGAAEDVPVIDLTVTTWNWLQTVDYTEYFALGTDHTHTNHQGADVIAGFVRDAIRDQQFGLEGYLR